MSKTLSFKITKSNITGLLSKTFHYSFYNMNCIFHIERKMCMLKKDNEKNVN